MNYTEIKTVEAAMAAMGVPATVTPDLNCWPKNMRQHKLAEWKLQIVIAAINEGWQPNWNDTSEYKYYPWWRIVTSESRSSGRGLSFSADDCAYSHSDVGPRLVFKDIARVYHAAEHFKDLYEEFYLG